MPLDDALGVLRGEVLYGSDESSGVLEIAFHRSTEPSARISSISTAEALALPGVVDVVTWPDVAQMGAGHYGYTIKDQPILAKGSVRFVGEAIAAVLATDRWTAARAAAAIVVEYERLPEVGWEEASDPGVPDLRPLDAQVFVPPSTRYSTAAVHSAVNVCSEFTCAWGEVESGAARIEDSVWERCDWIYVDHFRNDSASHLFLEPVSATATPVPGGFRVVSGTQSPFFIRDQLLGIFDLAGADLSVEASRVGGAFGGRGTMRTEAVALLFAMRTGRSVRAVMSPAEVMHVVRRHPMKISLRTGGMADGTFVAREVQISADAGAYADATPIVLPMAVYRALGPYRWSACASRGRAYYSNSTPTGPFRGFGGPQVMWASETQVNRIAQRLGKSPTALRTKNLLRPGEAYSPNERGLDSDLLDGLERLDTWLRPTPPDPTAGPDVVRARAVAVAAKDTGGINRNASARVEVHVSGAVRVFAGVVEVGQSTKDALRRIASEALLVPVTQVVVQPANTADTPRTEGAIASSGTAAIGAAVHGAARRAGQELAARARGSMGLGSTATIDVDWAARAARSGSVSCGFEELVGDQDLVAAGQGSAEEVGPHAAPPGVTPMGLPSLFWEVSWAGVEVVVDRVAREVVIQQVVTLGDVGRAVDLRSCHGQDIGACVMGLGLSLFEGHEPTTQPSDFRGYRVALAEDIPQAFHAHIDQQGMGPGPSGEKGAGESGILAIGGALVSAIESALGEELSRVPLAADDPGVTAVTALRP